MAGQNPFVGAGDDEVGAGEVEGDAPQGLGDIYGEQGVRVATDGLHDGGQVELEAVEEADQGDGD